MKNEIVIVSFPFDGFSNQKARPAVCLTEEIKPDNQVVPAFITSNVLQNPSDTDFVIDLQNTDFAQTGFKVSSTVRLHRLITVSSKVIKRELGKLSENQHNEIKN